MEKGQTLICPNTGARSEVMKTDKFNGEVEIKNENGVVSHWFAATLIKLGYTIEDDDEAKS